MIPLFDPERHCDLTNTPWSAALARTEITNILEEIEEAELPEGGWPLHPLDLESYPAVGPKWALYAGAAGMIIASEILRRAEYSAPDLRDRLPDIYQNYLRNPDVRTAEAGLQIGELGILTPALLHDPENSPFKVRALECMTTLIDHPAREITSGQTGMMHAALALYRATGQNCWKQAYQQGAEALWASWQEADDGSGWFWDNQIFGQTRSYFGACHGIAGNLNALLQGVDLLPGNRVTQAIDRAAKTLNSHAVRQEDKANWYASTAPIKGRLFVQWCHGAAGIVTALSAVPKNGSAASQTIDKLISDASALVWQAGPLVKGPGLCHGTAGNGYGFLALYKKEGKTHWLDKARAFAMHALEQSQAHRRHYGQRRYSLMTGDAGLAIYLHHCLKPKDAAFPGLELFA